MARRRRFLERGAGLRRTYVPGRSSRTFDTNRTGVASFSAWTSNLVIPTCPFVADLTISVRNEVARRSCGCSRVAV